MQELQNKSGFGWDDEKQLVTAYDKTWEALLSVCSIFLLLLILMNVLARMPKSSKSGELHPFHYKMICCIFVREL